MEGRICQHYKYGYCKYKNQCKKEHVEGKCEALSACPDIKACNKRYHKVCKQLAIQRFCRYGRECAYAHFQSETKVDAKCKETMVNDINIVKAELCELKETLIRVVSRDLETKQIDKSINILKDEINSIKNENASILHKIDMLVQGLEKETETKQNMKQSNTIQQEGGFSCKECNYKSRTKKDMKAHGKNHDKNKGKEWYTCDECQFSCQGLTTLKKHTNTRHPKANESSKHPEEETAKETNTQQHNDHDKSIGCCDSEEELALYEIELVDGGVVVVCNLCQEGFDMEDNIEKHMKDIHNKILGPNKWTSCLDRGCGICNECGIDKYQ